MAWQFRDQKQLILLDWVRGKLGPVFINNWHEPQYVNSDFVRFIMEKVTSNQPIIASEVPAAPTQLFSQRGLRCNLCSLNLEKTNKGIIYVSPHFLGKGDDFDIQGRTAEEVRQWLINNSGLIPYPIRLEKGVPWVHMDCEEAITGEKVQLVNP